MLQRIDDIEQGLEEVLALTWCRTAGFTAPAEDHTEGGFVVAKHAFVVRGVIDQTHVLTDVASAGPASDHVADLEKQSKSMAYDAKNFVRWRRSGIICRAA